MPQPSAPGERSCRPGAWLSECRQDPGARAPALPPVSNLGAECGRSAPGYQSAGVRPPGHRQSVCRVCAVHQRPMVTPMERRSVWYASALQLEVGYSDCIKATHLKEHAQIVSVSSVGSGCRLMVDAQIVSAGSGVDVG